MEVMTIENLEMQVREYNNQRVVTFKDVDKAHNKKSGTSRRNFNRNKEHFVNGVDYIVLSPNETDRHIRGIDKVPNRGLTLFTESGYLMLVKTFDDKLSWEVQRKLVNCYFKVKNQTNKLPEAILSEPETYNVSLTTLPKNQNWFNRNNLRMAYICDKIGCSRSRLYHRILLRLGAEYDLDYANKVYEQELGHKPKYAIDIVSYFPQLSRMADDYLDGVMAAIKRNEG